MIHSQTTERPDEKSIVLSHIAMAWNAAHIRYGVAHGLEGYPETTGRDLDILIEERYIADAIRLAVQELEARGYRVTVPPNPWQAEALYAFRDRISIQIDFIPRIFWGGAVLAEGASDLLVGFGPFSVDLWASFAKNVLYRILFGLEPKSPWVGSKEIANDRCSQLFGAPLAQILFESLEMPDAEALQFNTHKLRRSLIQRAILHKPLEFLRMIPRWAARRIRPFLTRRVPITALVGPDGVGKSTVIERLPVHIPEVFLGMRLRHWHPNLLPRLGELFGKPSGVTPTADGLILPRRKPGRFQTLRLAYYWFDFFLGHFIKDRRDSSGLKWVLYDRCALDMAVDPVRYGLSSARGTRLLWRLIPKPDLVILLHDDPERIHARKPELPVEEIARQNALWLQLAAEGEVDAILRVDAGPEEMAERVKELIIERFIERGKQAPGGRRDDLGWLRSVLGGGERDG